MLHVLSESLKWAKPSCDNRGRRRENFHVVFRLGPYRIARARLDLTILDLGEAAVSGQDADLSDFCGEELLLRSVPDRIALTPLCQKGGMFTYQLYDYDRCWVTTEGDFEDYLASFSKTSRKGLRRRVKQLESASGGDLDIRQFAKADVMGRFHNDARAISAKTFQEKLMDDGLPADDAFREDITYKAQRGYCYGSILYLENQPVSYLYCERQGGGWLAVYGGFDPAHAKLSPGTVHLVSILHQAFDDPDCTSFDFGPGRSDYKQFFATEAVPSADILILRKTARNWLVVNAHKALSGLTDRISRLVERLNLKTLLRQKIRGR